MSDGISKPVRGWFWWLSAILTPVGIFGGPVALMNLFAGIVEWNGVLGYVVNWWDVHIGEPFVVILSVITVWLGWPVVPHWLADYLAIGVLLKTGFWRAWRITAELGRVVMPIVPVYVSVPQAIFDTVKDIIAWPFLFLSTLISFMRQVRFRTFDIEATNFGNLTYAIKNGLPTGHVSVRHMVAYTLALAPFAIFVALFIANFWA